MTPNSATARVSSLQAYKDRICWPPTMKPKKNPATDVLKHPPQLRSVQDIFEGVKHLAAPSREVTICFYLSVRNSGMIFFGRILGISDHYTCLSDTGTILQPVFDFDCVNGIILVHSHKRTCKPTQKDIKATKAVEKVCNEVGIHLIDHLIFNSNTFFSFFKENMLQWNTDKDVFLGATKGES